MLALTTAKAFVYDLGSLDAAYRVLSFIGPGVLLLLSRYAYQHFMPGDPGDAGESLRRGPFGGRGSGEGRAIGKS